MLVQGAVTASPPIPRLVCSLVVTQTPSRKLESHQNTSLVSFPGIYCFCLGLFAPDGSPLHNVCARDINHLPGVVGVAVEAVPARCLLRRVEGAVRVGASRLVEEKMEGIGLTVPIMGNKRNAVGSQRPFPLVLCWRWLALRDGRRVGDLLLRFGLLCSLWSLVVFASAF